MTYASIIVVAVENALQAWRRRRERIRTRRIVESLPRRIRRDIGWALDAQAGRIGNLPDR